MAGAHCSSGRAETVDELTSDLTETARVLFAGDDVLDAVARQVIFYADNLTSDDGWPAFGPRAVRAGVRGVLALPLATSAGSGALNLYARSPGAFGVVDRAKGVILASLASLAPSAPYAHEDDDRRTSNLVTALTTREIIGQAPGVYMERERISGDQAFDVLRRASQHLNRKLRDVAQDLVGTDEQPDTGQLPTTP